MGISQMREPTEKCENMREKETSPRVPSVTSVFKTGASQVQFRKQARFFETGATERALMNEYIQYKYTSAGLEEIQGEVRVRLRSRAGCEDGKGSDSFAVVLCRELRGGAPTNMRR